MLTTLCMAIYCSQACAWQDVAVSIVSDIEIIADAPLHCSELASHSNPQAKFAFVSAEYGPSLKLRSTCGEGGRGRGKRSARLKVRLTLLTQILRQQHQQQRAMMIQLARKKRMRS